MAASAGIVVTRHRRRNTLIQLALDILSKNAEVILLAVVLWLYKELRSELADKAKALTSRTEKALEAYVDLALALEGYISDIANLPSTFDPKFVKAYPFLPNPLCTRLSDWRKAADREAAHAILQAIYLEMDRLKGYQTDEVSYPEAPTPSDFIARYYHAQLKNFVQPLLHTIVTFMCFAIASLWLIGFIQSATPRGPSITYTAGTLGVVFWIALAVFTVDLFVEHRFRHDWANWVAFILLLAIPLVAFVVKLSFWPYVVFGIALLYTGLFARRMVKRG